MKRTALFLSLVFILGASSAHAIELFGNKKSDEWRSQRFRNYDRDSNGKVSEEEFLHDTAEQFKNMDQDKNDSLSPDEVDFSPGTPDALKVQMRKQMQDDEKRRAEDEARQKAEHEKNMKEMEARMKEEREKTDKAAKAAAKAEPAPTETKTDAKTVPVVPAASAEPKAAPAEEKATAPKAAPAPASAAKK